MIMCFPVCNPPISLLLHFFFSQGFLFLVFNLCFYLQINLAPIILYYGVTNMVLNKHNNILCALTFSV